MCLSGQLGSLIMKFVGNLDKSGSAVAHFILPLKGVPIYVSAVAVNPALPHGVDLGNVEVVEL